MPTNSDAFISDKVIVYAEVMRGLIAECVGVLVDRFLDEFILVAGAGEKLDRQDVGVAVDDAAGHVGAHLRHPPRAVAHARHEIAQHDGVAGEPEQHRDGQPPVRRPSSRSALVP